jgi:hypothetical protein
MRGAGHQATSRRCQSTQIRRIRDPRESIQLALVAALQHLPPRQRAALLSGGDFVAKEIPALTVPKLQSGSSRSLLQWRVPTPVHRKETVPARARVTMSGHSWLIQSQ